MRFNTRCNSRCQCWVMDVSYVDTWIKDMIPIIPEIPYVLKTDAKSDRPSCTRVIGSGSQLAESAVVGDDDARGKRLTLISTSPNENIRETLVGTNKQYHQRPSH